MKASALIKGFRVYYKSLQRKRSIASLGGYRADELYDLVHQSAPVFVLSTGRCGTMLLSGILDATGSVEVHHEPVVELIYHSGMAYRRYTENKAAIQMLVDGARYEMIRNAWLNKKTYIETNNRITFFARALSELYPNARFIHLVRHPEAFVRSGLGRGWYTGHHLHDEGRIKQPGNPDWDQMPGYEKIAWLWQETNHYIEQFKEQQKDRCFFLKAEDLFNDPAKVEALIGFCGLKSPGENILAGALKKKVNARSKTVVLTEAQKSAVKRLTPLAAKYGY